jgi:hypothetical protein
MFAASVLLARLDGRVCLRWSERFEATEARVRVRAGVWMWVWMGVGVRSALLRTSVRRGEAVVRLPADEGAGEHASGVVALVDEDDEDEEGEHTGTDDEEVEVEEVVEVVAEEATGMGV